MSSAAIVRNMPYLATMPSCVLYVRPTGASSATTFKDWSLQKNTISNSGSASNSNTSTIFPPSSIYLGSGNGGLSIPNSTPLTLGSNNFLISGWFNCLNYTPYSQPNSSPFCIGGIINSSGYCGITVICDGQALRGALDYKYTSIFLFPSVLR